MFPVREHALAASYFLRASPEKDGNPRYQCGLPLRQCARPPRLRVKIPLFPYRFAASRLRVNPLFTPTPTDLHPPNEQRTRPGMNTLSPAPDLTGIDTWLFDLDNTLYSPAAGLFKQIDQRMGAYIMRIEDVDADAARVIQKRYFHDHGTTLAGLMAHHGVTPAHFLDYVHDIDLAVLTPNPALRAALKDLPGRRHIFTNADATYAQKVMEAVGIADLFDGITDIHATDYIPKPQAAAYQQLQHDVAGFAPERAVFFDDMTRNLAPAHAMGIRTVWLDNGSESGDRGHDPKHVDHHLKGSDVDALANWLKGVRKG